MSSDRDMHLNMRINDSADINKKGATADCEARRICDSIAFCGLVCALCHLSDNCGGCKSENNCCGCHTSAEGCYQYDCCTRKGIEGCWQCDTAPCSEGMFGQGHDLRLRAFIRYIKEYGKARLAERILENMKKGIYYGHGRDYDNLPNEASVFKMLE